MEIQHQYLESTDPATDEDDHDPTIIRVFDMALYKQLVTTAPYQYGDVHEFKGLCCQSR